MSRNDEETIARLVEAHGEGGLAPTADDWRAIFALGDRPVPILNLLAFSEKVATEDGCVSGAEAYAKYMDTAGPIFRRVGGERLFFGSVARQFGLEDRDDWDEAVLTRYPSPTSLAEMWLDPVYVAGHRNRESGVIRSKVLVFSA